MYNIIKLQNKNYFRKSAFLLTYPLVGEKVQVGFKIHFMVLYSGANLLNESCIYSQEQNEDGQFTIWFLTTPRELQENRVTSSNIGKIYWFFLPKNS